MPRIITITNCSECPHEDHRGAFGKIAYVPLCMKKHKTLPYTITEQRGRAYASVKEGIPSWCPLELKKE